MSETSDRQPERDPWWDRQRSADDRAGEACVDPEVLAAYADGALTDAERTQVDAHLADCGVCRAELLALVESDPAAMLDPRDASIADPREGLLTGVTLTGVALTGTGASGVDAPEDAAPTHASRRVVPFPAPKPRLGPLRIALPLAASLLVGVSLWLMFSAGHRFGFERPEPSAVTTQVLEDRPLPPPSAPGPALGGGAVAPREDERTTASQRRDRENAASPSDTVTAKEEARVSPKADAGSRTAVDRVERVDRVPGERMPAMAPPPPPPAPSVAEPAARSESDRQSSVAQETLQARAEQARAEQRRLSREREQAQAQGQPHAQGQAPRAALPPPPAATPAPVPASPPAAEKGADDTAKQANAPAGFASNIRDGWLTGRIVDTAGNPLPGATVNLIDAKGPRQTLLSDADGRFTLQYEGQAPVTLFSSLAGFQPAQRKVNPADSRDRTITLALEPAMETVAVTAAPAPARTRAEVAAKAALQTSAAWQVRTSSDGAIAWRWRGGVIQRRRPSAAQRPAPSGTTAGAATGTVAGSAAGVDASADADWVVVYTDPGERILSASLPAPNVAWFSGAKGLVIIVRDGVPTVRRAASDEDLIRVDAVDARRARVTLAGGRQYRTEDGGVTWTP